MTTTARTLKDDRSLTGATVLRLATGVALSVASGLLMLLAFPPYGLWPLIWIAFIPALVAQYRVLPLRYSRLARALALGVWLQPFLARLFGAEAPLVLKYLGTLIALLTLLLNSERPFHERTNFRWFVAQGAADWVGVEMIRSFIPVMGTAGFLANTMATQPWLLQPIAVFSIYGLNLLVVIVNFALAMGALALIDRRWPDAATVTVNPRRTLTWLGGAAAGLVVWTVIGLIVLAGAPSAAPTVRVAALQPDFTVPGQFVEPAEQAVRVDILLDQAREAAEQGAQILVAPELAFGFDPQVEQSAEFTAFTAETGTYLVIPYGFSTEAGWRNEAVLLTPDGTFEGVYGKNHVFPGEPRIITAGVYPVNETPFGNLGTAICHDSNFTDVSRRLARNGAQFIAIPTFEPSGWGEQQWTHAVMRAVENRVAIVQTGTAFSSIIVDPYGRIVELAVTPQGEQVTLVGDVPFGTGRTLLRYLGDWLGWVSLAGFAAFIVLMSRKPKEQAVE